MKSRTRWLIGIVFTLAVMICALFVGVAVGGLFFVPAGSGLAGPAIAIGYGFVAAAMGAVAAILLAIFLPGRWLVGATVVFALIAGALAVATGRGYLRSVAETQAHLNEAYKRLPAFTVTIAYPDGVASPPFKRFAADWAKRQYSVTAEGEGARTCTVPLTGPDAVKLLGALRDVEGLLLNEPDPCAGYTGAVDHGLTFFINEVKPPDNQGDLTVTDACLTAFPALGAPATAAADLHDRNGMPHDCG